jgi:hypothetical protein
MHLSVLAQRVSKDPEGLSEEEVRNHLLYLRRERSYVGSTMNQVVASLRMFYRDQLGKQWELWKQIRVNRIEKLPVVLSRQEVAAVLRCVERHRFQIFFRLVYHCGLRLAEALAVAPMDIDAVAGRLHLRTTKGGKDRYVPIAASMVEDLRKFWKRHRNPQWMFPGVGAQTKRADLLEAARTSRQPMSASSVQAAFKLALVQSGVSKAAVIHTLRHSYATHLLEEGVSIRLISQYLGHACLETTLVYTHLTAVSEEKTREVISRLDATLHSS